MRPFEFCVLGLSELALFGAQTLRCPLAVRPGGMGGKTFRQPRVNSEALRSKPGRALYSGQSRRRPLASTCLSARLFDPASPSNPVTALAE